MQHRKNESDGYHFFPASLLEFKFKCDYFFELYKKVIKISKKKTEYINQSIHCTSEI